MNDVFGAGRLTTLKYASELMPVVSVTVGNVKLVGLEECCLGFILVHFLFNRVSGNVPCKNIYSCFALLCAWLFQRRQ